VTVLSVSCIKHPKHAVNDARCRDGGNVG